MYHLVLLTKCYPSPSCNSGLFNAWLRSSRIIHHLTMLSYEYLSSGFKMQDHVSPVFYYLAPFIQDHVSPGSVHLCSTVLCSTWINYSLGLFIMMYHQLPLKPNYCSPDIVIGIVYYRVHPKPVHIYHLTPLRQDGQIDLLIHFPLTFETFYLLQRGNVQNHQEQPIIIRKCW